MNQPMPTFRLLRPAFVSGLLDDPILLVQNRVSGRSLMFDCGQIHHLAKRVLMSLDTVFISHGHMDHLMGVDLLFRHLHAIPRILHLYGPPGLTERIAHKLKGYDWNLAEDYWATFVVNEVHDGHLRTTSFIGPNSFEQQSTEKHPFDEDIIYRDRYLQVRARRCEHRIPSLIYRVEERPFYLIDEARLKAQGYQPGLWLGILKERLLEPVEDDFCLQVPRQVDGDTVMENWTDMPSLYKRLQKEEHPGGVGYISDIGWTQHNQQQIQALMPGIKLLVCECTFCASEVERARSSAHLCTVDVNEILQRVQPEALLTMHMSKRYRDRGESLYQELKLPPETSLIRIPQFTTAAPLTMSDFS